jgi:hypothetical protein
MAYEPNIHSEVKITNEADLDGSSDGSLPPLLAQQSRQMASLKVLKPLKVELKDSAPIL